MSKEAIKQMTDALGKARSRIIEAGGSGWKMEAQRCTNAIEAGRQAIADFEKQEPVMGVEVKRIASGGFVGNVWWIHENLQEGVFHLYTHPQPKREPLTDEQIAEFFGVKAVDESFVDFVRAIEAAHGIKK